MGHTHSIPPIENIIKVMPSKSLNEFITKPLQLSAKTWPPTQVTYLDEYLKTLGCRTIVHESHYIDRDYMADLAAFYSRSLRNYPNFCRRLHFFKQEFDLDAWQKIVAAATPDKLLDIESELNNGYLGYIVLRPLEGCPIGRTVLRPFPQITDQIERQRFFGATKRFRAHLAGFKLSVHGLPFQQQDQGVSACATTALWSSLQKIAPMERCMPPTPADITEAASRYLLTGRALPSGGLGIQQMCEAIRISGFEPVLITSVGLNADRGQLLTYLRSEFAPVLCIQPISDSSDGHAVCLTGAELGPMIPITDPNIFYHEEASRVTGLYLHDDRLGPYARANLSTLTVDGGKLATSLSIQFPGETDKDLWEQSKLIIMLVPVPAKLRLNVNRMLEIGRVVAQAIGVTLHNEGISVVLKARYALAVKYRESVSTFGLSEAGNYELLCSVVMPRYLGVIEICSDKEPIADLLLDTTETEPNPSQLAFILRAHTLKDEAILRLQAIAEAMDVRFIV